MLWGPFLKRDGRYDRRPNQPVIGIGNRVKKHCLRFQLPLLEKSGNMSKIF